MDTPIKVLYIDEIGRIDGAEVVLLNLLAKLDRNKFVPEVVCGSNGELVNRLKDLDITVHVLPIPEVPKRNPNSAPLANLIYLIYFLLKGFSFQIELYKLIVKLNPEIIHTNSLLANVLGTFPAKIALKKLIWHEHNIQPKGFRRTFVNILSLCTDKIIVISDAVSNVYCGAIRRRKVLKIYNGLDLSLFSSNSSHKSIRHEFSIPRNFKIVAITAVLRPWKGHDVFLNAAKIVLENYKAVRFMVVGGEVFSRDRGYKKKLEDLVHNLDMDGYVTFTGYRNDIPDILNSIDILVSSTILPEPFSLIVLEAMAAAKPVVATNTGGVPEVVDDSVTGLLVNPNDASSMADAILRILMSDELANDMGTEGAKRARCYFTSERMAKEVESLYITL